MLALASRAIAAGARPALVAALPAYAGLVLLVAVLMGKSAMQPGDMAAAAASSLGVRALLWVAWLAAMAPAARLLILAPELLYLSWLPIPPATRIGTAAALLVGLELPWAALWSAAAGPGAGIAAAAAAAGFHAALAVRPRRAAELAAAGLGLAAIAAALAAAPRLGAAAAIAGAAVLALALPAALSRAAEAPRPLPAPRPRGGAIASLAAVLAGAALSSATAGRLIVAAAVAGGLAGGFIRLNELSGIGVAAAAAAAASLGAIGVATEVSLSLQGGAADLRWLLRATATRGETAAAAVVAVAAAAALVTAAAIAAVAAAIAGFSAALLATAPAAVGVFAVAAAAASRESRPSTAWVWSRTLLGALGLALAPAVFGPAGLLLAAPAVILAFARVASA
jgi:hypothetical protein